MEFTTSELALLRAAAITPQEEREEYALKLIVRGDLNIPQITELTGMCKRDVYNLKRRHKMHNPVHQAKLALFRERKRDWTARYLGGVDIRKIAHDSDVPYQTVYNVLYAAGVLRKTVNALPVGPRKERDAEIFRLRAGGMPPMQIAREMNIKIDTLRAILRRAKLREKEAS